MKKQEFLKRINKQLIISVQGVEEEPTNNAKFLAISARAVVAGGAKVLRCSQVAHIKAIKKELGQNFPIIGLIKKRFKDSEVFITPTKKEIDSLAKIGVEAIALDATLRKRVAGAELEELVKYAKTNYPNIALMADCATEEEIVNADRLGFDIVSSTLRGYTKNTKGESNTKDDFAFVKKIMKLNLKSIFITEGGIWTPEDAAKALRISDAVVVGSAITRPHLIAQKYFEASKGIK